MGKITLTPDEATMLRQIGTHVAGPRHTRTLSADDRTLEVGSLPMRAICTTDLSTVAYQELDCDHGREKLNA